MTKKIAFLFLTRDNLLHDKIWAHYFKGQTNYSIYCHPSNKNATLKGVLEGSKIDKHINTTWGHTALAHQALLAAALKNQNNFKFIICSESCVPMQSFDKLYEFLTLNDNSYIKQDTIAQRIFDERNLNEHLDKLIFLKKHAANYCLNRIHAHRVVDAPHDTMQLFQEMSNGDEHFLSVIWESEYEDTIKDTWIVYSNWKYTEDLCNQYTKKAEREYQKYIKMTNKKQKKKQRKKIGKMWALIHEAAKHPQKYDKITDATFQKLRKYLFVRKFAATSNIAEFLM